MTDENDKLKESVNDYEKQILVIRRQNDEYDMQLKTAAGKLQTLENELKTVEKERDRLNDLVNRLQREKQDILR